MRLVLHVVIRNLLVRLNRDNIEDRTSPVSVTRVHAAIVVFLLFG
jgi:hypothetical protein